MKGFGQKKGIDFDEIFSPDVKMSSIRVVLGMAASMNLEVEQLDVKILKNKFTWSNRKVLWRKGKRNLFAN